MKVVHVDYRNISAKVDDLSIILGYFDGVHLGHQHLIIEARKYAKHPLAILTFDKSISSLISTGKTPEVLTSLDDRFKVISKLGVDYYYLFHIDRDFLNLSYLDFIDLLKKMNVREVFVGEDFRFGKDRIGKPQSLTDFFSTRIIDLVKENGDKISSQHIKDLLELGKIEEANKLLGHNYQMSGTPISGKGIGQKIGFPTINLKLAENYVLPRFGVYKTIVYLDGVPHLAITNVGVNPTIDKGNVPTIESHLKEYNQENVSQVSVEFLEFVRPEIKFESLDELKKQIDSDVKKVFKI